jgi:hypothetical protein
MGCSGELSLLVFVRETVSRKACLMVEWDMWRSGLACSGRN